MKSGRTKFPDILLFVDKTCLLYTSIQLTGLKGMEQRYSSRISQAPTFERISTDIERQRSIRSNLYLMLLTRREETSIELASSLESAKVVDSALAASKPSSPKKPIIYLASLLPVSYTHLDSLLIILLSGPERIVQVYQYRLVHFGL